MLIYLPWAFPVTGRTNHFGNNCFKISHNHIFPLARLAEPCKGIFLLFHLSTSHSFYKLPYI